MKKFLAMTLAALMVLAMLPAVAFATPAPAKVRDAGELAAAVAVGGEIELVDNINFNTPMVVETDVVIDMKGFEIVGTPTGSWTVFRVNAPGKLTLKNTSDRQSLLQVAKGEANEAGYEGIRITGGGVVHIERNVAIEAGCPVFIVGNNSDEDPDVSACTTKLYVSGRLEVSAPISHGQAYAAIQGNGTKGKGGTYIEINDGAEIYNAFSQAMYIPQSGHVVVNGGTIVGEGAGIAIKSGRLTIEGGTIVAKGPLVDPPDGWSNGINASGCAIQIESNSDYWGALDVIINDGDFMSRNGYALYEYIGKGDNTRVFGIHVNGGRFMGSSRLNSPMLFSSQLMEAGNKLEIDYEKVILANGAETEVTASVAPTFIIEIPSQVNFGKLTKGQPESFVYQPFRVTASGLLLEKGARVDIRVLSDFAMTDGREARLPYKLRNKHNAEFSSDQPSGPENSNGVYTSFSSEDQPDVDGNVIDVGEVEVDQALIQSAGNYSGNMIFVIEYNW